MIPQIKWVDLVFDFPIHPGRYPSLIERLAGTPARLEEKLKGWGETALTRKGDGWSVQEHAGHLYDLEELIERRLDDFESGAIVLSAADMTNQKTYQAEYNDKEIKDILMSFRRSRTDIIKRMQQYDEVILLKTALHPRLNKQISIIDLVYFFAEHDDHHLAIITAILNKN